MDLRGSWTDAELTAIRIALELEASRLRTGIAVAAHDYGSNVGDAIDGTGGEVGDVGSLMVELTEGSSIESNEIDILHQYELALERIRRQPRRTSTPGTPMSSPLRCSPTRTPHLMPSESVPSAQP